MKKVLNTLLMSILCLGVYAQSDVDALRYSMTDLNSTARGLGAGGAFGALGADHSSASTNPAGIGLYRKNQFFLSAGMLNAKNESDYLGSSLSDIDFNLNVPDVGLVFSVQNYVGRKPAKKGWLYTNFSMGMNKRSNFNRLVNYKGVNENTSMLDYFADRASGLSVQELSGTDNEFDYGFNDIETMAWEGYLIDSVGDRQYGAALGAESAVTQKQIINTSGGMNDFHFNLASNYSNKWYIGGGITVTSVNYKENDKYTEYDDVNNGGIWDEWTLTRELQTTGIGIRGNLGLIIKPTDWLRIGASLQTPSIYSLNDSYNDELISYLDDGDSYEYKSKDGEYEYKLVTPMKSTLSAAAVLGKKGFVSVDADFVDFSTMRLRPTIDAFEVANDNIREKYDQAINLRIGGEYVLDMYRFRAGYASYGSPLKSSTDGDLSRNFFTAGIGIKEANWGLDLALVHERRSDMIQPYVLNGIPVESASNKLVNNSIVLTLSTNF